MKKLFRSWQLIALCGVVLGLSSCEKDDDNGEYIGGEGNVLVSAVVKNADGASGTSYFLQMPSLSGTISLANSVQAGFASTMSVNGNDVYIFPEFGNDGTQKITRYERSFRGLRKAAERQIIPGSYPQHIIIASPSKAYIPLYSLGRVEVVHPKTLEKLGEIDLKEYAHGDASCEPAHGIIRDGLYYLPLDQLDSGWMPYDDHRQVDVVVIDTQTDKVVNIIRETKTGLSFPTRPMLEDMIFTNEQNDIYIACAGYFAYNPQDVKSGFVCIPAGKQEFDTSRSWDISNTPIEGSEYKAATVYNTKYIGNGKVAAYVGLIELTTNNPYTARNSMAVIIDLKNKTIKKINGIPYTDGHSIEIEYHNGTVYFAAFGENSAGVFSYNPSTEQVEHILKWNNNVAYIHFF